MLYFRGAAAIPHFRKERLLDQIIYKLPQVTDIQAHFIYFIDEESPETSLTIQEKGILSDLLSFAELIEEQQLKDDFDIKLGTGMVILVVPRYKSQSSWSGRVTDIVHHCQLKKIKRIEYGIFYTIQTLEKMTWEDQQIISNYLHDPVKEQVLFTFQATAQHFMTRQIKKSLPLNRTNYGLSHIFDVMQRGQHALNEANQQLGLGLNLEELNYLTLAFQELKHNPSDVELMIYAQLNSEANRHKLVNAQWIIDGHFKPQSLLSMLKSTIQLNPRGILSAFEDHAAVIAGGMGSIFVADPITHLYITLNEQQAFAIKVASSNQTIGISPYVGGASGIAADIQNETATGRGARPKAGLVGFSVSNLNIPGFVQPWEFQYGKPSNLNSALDIILENSLGAAQYANEVGRPAITGYFRTFQMQLAHSKKPEIQGYQQPIMIAGGLAVMRPSCMKKKMLKVGMQIGLLGGLENENFTSVQQGNAENERKCQEVVSACINLGDKNPIVAIHDVASGALATSISKFIFEAHLGGRFVLQDIDHHSALELWSNSAQICYIIVLQKDQVNIFQQLARRESCAFSIIGEIIEEPFFECQDQKHNWTPIQLPLSLLFANIPRERRETFQKKEIVFKLELPDASLKEMLERILRLPSVADKSFLITIQDRSASGLVLRDQMVGPWQVPVADCGVIARDYIGYEGEAIAMGERPLLALINKAASARMALGEAITNIAAACIGVLSDVRLSANWIIAAGDQDAEAGLYEAIQALALELCPALNLTIAMSNEEMVMQAHTPLTMIISAFAPVMDIRRSLTPYLYYSNSELEETRLLFIDLAEGQQRLGGSALAQVFNQIGDSCPDLESPSLLKRFFTAIQQLNLEDKILAYHDRSDGGLFITLLEMAFASHSGLNIDMSFLGEDPIAILFNEELGVVIQVKTQDLDAVITILNDHQLTNVFDIGTLDKSDRIIFIYEDDIIFSENRITLQKSWSETSYQLQALRDNPRTAKKQWDCIEDVDDPGLSIDLSFDMNTDINLAYIQKGVRPKVAILREQGIYGQKEMAAAFFAAGFDPIDVHTNDLASGEISLRDFKGLAVGAGFSFGDGLGAGRGWAKRILYESRLNEQFSMFFSQPDTFTLGTGNGCQMLAQLKNIIPGAELWPNFVQNHSEQFECRLCLVEIDESPSILLQGMQNSRLLAAVAHKEGYAEFQNEEIQSLVIKKHLAPIRYIDTRGRKTNVYPANPNGSPLGITGLTNLDGRVTIMMPHPERGFRTVQYSWRPRSWEGEEGPWLQLFRNARIWLE